MHHWTGNGADEVSEGPDNQCAQRVSLTFTKQQGAFLSLPLPVGGKMASICFEAGFPVYFNAVSYSAVAIFALAEVIFHCGSGPHVSVLQLNRLKLQSVRCPRPKSQQGPPEGHRGSRSDRHGHHPNCLPHNATAHKQCRVPAPPACVFLCVCVCDHWPLSHALWLISTSGWNIKTSSVRYIDTVSIWSRIAWNKQEN